jgi:hypothetical protein
MGLKVYQNDGVIDELKEAVKTGESGTRKRSDGEQLKKSRNRKEKSKKKV